MGFSTGRELHVDAHLTNLALNFRPSGFIADMIAPIVNVDKADQHLPPCSRVSRHTPSKTRSARRVPKRRRSLVRLAAMPTAARTTRWALTLPHRGRGEHGRRVSLRTRRRQVRYLLTKLGLDYEKRVISLAVVTASVGSVFVCNSGWQGAGSGAGDAVSQIFQLNDT